MYRTYGLPGLDVQEPLIRVPVLLREIRTVYRTELASAYPAEEIDQIFHDLLEHYLGLPRFVLGLEPHKILDRDQEQPLFEALASLKRHVPLQYITGKAYFMDMELAVGPGVLIPRPETEELVRWILEAHAGDLSAGSLLDAGTGSGCIAIALAVHLPGSQVHALDCSLQALQYARRNAASRGVEIHWHQADMRNPGALGGPFDLIVSNPPYVPVSEAAAMRPNVREHEPAEALFAPDDDPLLFYRSLLGLARAHLKPGGWLYVEIHEQFGPAVEALLAHAGMQEVQLKKDIFGKPRFVRAQLSTHQTLKTD